MMSRSSQVTQFDVIAKTETSSMIVHIRIIIWSLLFRLTLSERTENTYINNKFIIHTHKYTQTSERQRNSRASSAKSMATIYEHNLYQSNNNYFDYLNRKYQPIFSSYEEQKS